VVVLVDPAFFALQNAESPREFRSVA